MLSLRSSLGSFYSLSSKRVLRAVAYVALIRALVTFFSMRDVVVIPTNLNISPHVFNEDDMQRMVVDAAPQTPVGTPLFTMLDVVYIARTHIHMDMFSALRSLKVCGKGDHK